jgi:sortase B
MMKTLKKVILPLSFFCLLVCAVFFIHYFSEVLQEKNAQEELILKKTVTEGAITKNEPAGEKEILAAYKTLYAENPDIIGWVKIEGTRLDYPVMQTRNDNEYYLHRNFEKEYQYSGLILWMRNATSTSRVRI